MTLVNQSKLLILTLLVAVCVGCSAKRTVSTQREVTNNRPANTEAVNIPPPEKPVLRPRPPYIMVAPGDSVATKYAKLLGVKKSEIKNGRLYDFIDQWMGAPYAFGGLERSGVDCSGFVYLLQQQVYDITDMPRSSNLQINYIKRKYENELKEGDLVFFDFDGKPLSHVGIYLTNGYVVHASTSKGVMIVKLHSPYMYKYFSRGGSVIDPAIDLPMTDAGTH